MKTLRDASIDPPTGWVYPIDDKLTIQGVNLDDLIFQTLQHFTINALPLPVDLEQKILDWLCLHNPHGWCVDETGRTPFSLKHTLSQLTSGTEVMINRLRHGKADLVSVQEAEVRAAICRQCPFMAPNACSSCSGMKKIFGRLVEDRWLVTDQTLQSCAICGCFIGIMSNFTGAALRAITPPDRVQHYPKEFTSRTGRTLHCWKRSLLEAEAVLVTATPGAP